MATWPGWIIQFLAAANIINTPPNQRFMTQWSQHATSNCRNNPIDLSHPLSGSSRCANNTGINPETQRYTSHAQAARAFDIEIHQPWAKALLDALRSGNPYQLSPADTSAVGSVLVSWGSDGFFRFYLNEQQKSAGGGGSGGIAPRTHKAWIDLQRSVNRRLPDALRAASRANRATLRAISRARKVRL